MGFFDFFRNSPKKMEIYTSSTPRPVSFLPRADEKELALITCIAGLFARVAYVDFELHADEFEHMGDALEHWTAMPRQDIEAIVRLAVEEIRELAGLELHVYTPHLVETLSVEQRYGILESLFTLAASDGEVADRESEEIRLIARGLLLENKHFISARATVADYLAALKKD